MATSQNYNKYYIKDSTQCLEEGDHKIYKITSVSYIFVNIAIIIFTIMIYSFLDHAIWK